MASIMVVANDMLDAVVAELGRRRGELGEIAGAAGMSYDTVLRIRRGTNDPGYSKVKRLAQVLGVVAHPAAADSQTAGHG